ncbi:hypothetical protein ISS04_02240 [Candidatus Woesearchaeota archaeon]|nr:hypothetical protein [Candidatus Woesearchaeota archaeon]
MVDVEVVEEIEKKIKKLIGCKYVRLVDRGNSAIFIALSVAKQKGFENVLIPDQGGWLTYLQFPKKVGFGLERVKTEYGLIDSKNLKEKSGCLLYQNLAGYFAEQQVKKIYKVCKGKNFVILDICSIGGRFKRVADIFIGSFGRWKVVDAGYGGFIGTNDERLFSLIKGFEGYDFDENNSEILLEKLKGAKKRLKWLYDKNKKVKKDLKGFNVIHRGDKGINVVVKYCCEEEKQKILKYCNKHDYQYTLCPRYIRVKDEAISIEIKRLEKN